MFDPMRDIPKQGGELMSPSVPMPELPEPDGEQLDKMSDDELRAILARGWAISVVGLRYMAAAWVRLQARGVDMTELRAGLLAYAPLIVEGTVLPEVIMQYAGEPRLLRIVSGLPRDQQRDLAEMKPVRVAVRTGSGFTVQMKSPLALTGDEIKQVFGDRCIRTETEQQVYLTKVTTKPRKQRTRYTVGESGTVKVDRKTRTVWINRTCAPLDDMLAALRAAGELK